MYIRFVEDMLTTNYSLASGKASNSIQKTPTYRLCTDYLG